MSANAAASVVAVGVDAAPQVKVLKKVNGLVAELQDGIEALEAAVAKASGVRKLEKEAEAYRDIVIPAMNAVRAPADELEQIVDAEIWPLPSYAEMLFIK